MCMLCLFIRKKNRADRRTIKITLKELFPTKINRICKYKLGPFESHYNHYILVYEFIIFYDNKQR